MAFGKISLGKLPGEARAPLVRDLQQAGTRGKTGFVSGPGDYER